MKLKYLKMLTLLEGHSRLHLVSINNLLTRYYVQKVSYHKSNDVINQLQFSKGCSRGNLQILQYNENGIYTVYCFA